MGRTTLAMRALNGGELSERLSGRSDLPNYASSATLCENLIPLVPGPVMRRSGTRFVKAVKDASQPVALLPFVVSTEASYVIEAGNLYFRFYTEEARLEAAGVPVEIVTPYTSAQVFELQFAQSADTLYIVHPLHAPRKLVRTSATTFSLTAISFLDGPYLDENTDETKTLAFGAVSGATTCTAVGHTPFLAGRDEGRHIRSRVGATDGACFWAKITAVTTTALVNVTILSDQDAVVSAEYRWKLGAWYVGNYPTAVTFSEQRLCFGGPPDFIQRVDLSVTDDYERFSPTGSIDDKDGKVYSSPDIFADNGFGYTIGSSELNAVLWMRIHQRLTIGTSRSIYEMAASSQNEALTPDNANVSEVDMTGAAAMPAVRMANMILFTGRDRRSLHALGFSLEDSSSIASNLTELSDHVAGDGIVQIASTPQPVPTVWICTSDGQLASLTLQPRQKVFAWSRHPIGGSNPGYARSHVRSICAIPVELHDQLWIIAERWVDGVKTKSIEFAEQPFRLVVPGEAPEESFFVDGGVSYDSPIAITNATQANPVVVTAPSHGLADGTKIRIRDVIGMTELNGKSFLVSAAGLHTFELQTPLGAPVNGLGFTAYGAGGEIRVHATTFSGLGHLEGETVSILADGAVRSNAVVSGATVTLSPSASEVHVGLACPALFVSQRLDSEEREGPSGGKSRSFDAVTLRLLDSLGGEVGAGAEGPWVRIPYRKGDDPMDAAPPIFTGEVRLTFPGGWSREPRIAFRQTEPLPFTLLSAVLMGEVGGR